MLTFVTILHVLLCVFMIFVILLQPGKDAGMGAALGGGAASSAFGGRGAVTFLTKLTSVCAALFFLTSLALSFVGLKPSVVVGGAEPPPAPAAASPAVPEAPIPAGAASIDKAEPQEGKPVEPPATPAQSVPAAPSGEPKREGK